MEEPTLAAVKGEALRSFYGRLKGENAESKTTSSRYY